MNIKLLRITFGIIMFLLIAVLLRFNVFSKLLYEPESVLVVADSSRPISGLIYIADKRGYFREEGLKVSYRKFKLGKDALNDTISGYSDIAATYGTPFIRKVFEGENIKIISTLSSSSGNFVLLTRKDKNINQVEDLKGKTIAVTKGTSLEFFLYYILINNGVKVPDVSLVNTKPKQLENAFSEGKVDAVVAWDAWLYDILQNHKEEVNVFRSEDFLEIAVLAGEKDILKKKEKEMVKFLKALKKAEEFSKSNKNESVNIISKRLSDQPEKFIIENSKRLNLQLGLTNTLLAILTLETGWLQEVGVYKGDIADFRDYLFPDLLEKAYPQSVTYFRF